MSCWYYMKRRQEEELKANTEMAESGVAKDITPVVEVKVEVTEDKPIVNIKKNSRKKKES